MTTPSQNFGNYTVKYKYENQVCYYEVSDCYSEDEALNRFKDLMDYEEILEVYYDD